MANNEIETLVPAESAEGFVDNFDNFDAAPYTYADMWEAEAAFYDDDPNPYHGDYSEM